MNVHNTHRQMALIYLHTLWYTYISYIHMKHILKTHYIHSSFIHIFQTQLHIFKSERHLFRRKNKYLYEIGKQTGKNILNNSTTCKIVEYSNKI